MRVRSILPLLGLLAAPAFGLEPYLVKDINQVPSPGSSHPEGLTALGGAALFAASDPLSGRELWRSDGTAAGTYQLADACPGECSGSPRRLAVTERHYFFVANSRANDYFLALWVSDGAPAGTEELWGPLQPDSEAVWVKEQKILYFSARSSLNESGLWRSDGTSLGTYQFVTFASPHAHPTDLRAFKGRLWFVLNDGKRGPALWVSDGTEEGTRLAFDPVPGSKAHVGPSGLRVLGKRLYFVAPDSRGREGLWVSQGTKGGPVLLLRLPQSRPAAMFHASFRLHNGRVFFVAQDARRGQELWVTDGTPKGTRVLTAFPRREAFFSTFGESLDLPDSSPTGRFVFRAHDGSRGMELWSSDGTPKGTRLVRDLCPGPCDGVRSIWSIHRGRLYLRGSDGLHGGEVWLTDGTGAGTRQVRDLCPGECSSDPFPLGAIADRLLFGAEDGEHGSEIWATDGTNAGTVRLSDFDLDEPWERPSPAALPGKLLFNAVDTEHGRELWVSDGTAAGTHLALDIYDADVGGSYAARLRAFGDEVVFFATDGIHGFELWKSDGTEEGTSLLAELVPGPEPSSSPPEGVSLQAAGKLFFDVGPFLWRTDGTATGTFRLTADGVLLCCGEATPLTALADTVFFGAFDAAHGWELWASDGTVAGTRRIKDIAPGPVNSGATDFAVFQGKLHFTANVDGERELWRSDGTPAGTVRIAGIGPSHEYLTAMLTVHAGRLWFFGDDGEHGRELWSSDGTAAGTSMQVDLVPGPEPSAGDFLVSLPGKLLISAVPIPFGIWASDGTPEGTERIGSAVFFPKNWIVFKGRFYFSGIDPVSFAEGLWVSDGTEEGTGPLRNRDGMELPGVSAFAPLGDRLLFTTSQTDIPLWETDGTESGTFRIRNLLPGSVGTWELVAAGSRVYFQAFDPATGRELWAIADD